MVVALILEWIFFLCVCRWLFEGKGKGKGEGGGGGGVHGGSEAKDGWVLSGELRGVMKAVKGGE